MAPARTTTSGKTPSKMSKGELLLLFNTTAAENEGLVKKYGQYTRVSCGQTR